MSIVSYVEKQTVTVTSALGASFTLVDAGGSALNGGSGVTMSRAIVFYSIRSTRTSSAKATWYALRCELTSSTTVTFNRHAFDFSQDAVIDVVVIEFASGVATVQRGTATATADPTDVTISAITTSRALALVSFSTDQDALSNDTTPVASFTSTTNLRLDYLAAPSGSNSIVHWQVIEFSEGSGVTTEYASVSFGVDDVTKTDTITSVDTSRTFLSFAGICGSTAFTDGLYESRCTVELTDATTVTFTRGVAADTNNRTAIAGAWVVQLPSGAAVQQGVATIADAAFVPASQPSFTALTENECSSWEGHSIGNFRTADSGETLSTTDGSVRATVILDGTRDGMTIQRGDDVGDVHVGWTAIDWNTGGGGGGMTRPLIIPWRHIT